MVGYEKMDFKSEIWVVIRNWNIGIYIKWWKKMNYEDLGGYC